MRQSLVDYCRERQLAIHSARTNLAEIEEEIGDTSLDLIKADAIEMGKQLALREVCEWAQGHQVPDIGAGKYSTKGG